MFADLKWKCKLLHINLNEFHLYSNNGCLRQVVKLIKYHEREDATAECKVVRYICIKFLNDHFKYIYIYIYIYIYGGGAIKIIVVRKNLKVWPDIIACVHVHTHTHTHTHTHIFIHIYIQIYIHVYICIYIYIYIYTEWYQSNKVWWYRELLLGRSGLVVIMLRPRNHPWTQIHYLNRVCWKQCCWINISHCMIPIYIYI